MLKISINIFTFDACCISIIFVILIMTTLNKSQYIEYLAHKLDEALLTEGKHWPEDHKKTAFNTIKSSELGKQEWHSDDFIEMRVL